MPLADDLAQLESNAPRTGCKLGWIIDQLDTKTAEALVNALKIRADATKIRAALDKYGHKVGYDAVLRHGRTIRGESGGCNCQ